MDAVPYIVHESSMARMERVNKRLWIVVLVLLALVLITNGLWLWYESQWEYYDLEVTQENDRGLNTFVGGDGEVYYGDKATEEIFTDDSH